MKRQKNSAFVDFITIYGYLDSAVQLLQQNPRKHFNDSLFWFHLQQLK